MRADRKRQLFTDERMEDMMGVLIHERIGVPHKLRRLFPDATRREAALIVNDFYNHRVRETIKHFAGLSAQQA